MSIVRCEARESKLREALERIHHCVREEPSHRIPTDPNDRAWCFDCREWCYSTSDMACSGCIARQALADTTEEASA